MTAIITPLIGPALPLPLMLSPVAAGFPSPADDYIERQLDLNEHLVTRPAATFYVRASGRSMIGAGIHEGDLLIVDRGEPPSSGRVVVAVVDGQLTVKRLCRENGRLWLCSDPEDAYPRIGFDNAAEGVLWGVVTAVVHRP